MNIHGGWLVSYRLSYIILHSNTFYKVKGKTNIGSVKTARDKLSPSPQCTLSKLDTLCAQEHTQRFLVHQLTASGW